MSKRLKRCLRSWYMSWSCGDWRFKIDAVAIHAADRIRHVDGIGVEQREDLGLLFAETAQVALIFLGRIDA